MNTQMQMDRQSLDFTRFQAMTFDCYGTLIDWESGLLGAMHPILHSHGKQMSDSEVLKIYGELEPKEQNPYQRYRTVLANIVPHFVQVERQRVAVLWADKRTRGRGRPLDVRN